MNLIKVNSRKPDRKAILKAAEIIKDGGLVVFPTETLYGLGANAFDPRAVSKIFRVKGRSEQKPLIILIARKEDLRGVACDIPPLTWKLVKKFWPGPLTLVLKKKKIIPKEVSAGSNTIAVRLSPHPVARALVSAAGVPITAPSANLSGKRPHHTIAGALKELGNKKEINLFLDAGKTPIGKPSTLVDLTKNPPRILREGSITKKQLKKVIGRIA